MRKKGPSLLQILTHAGAVAPFAVLAFDFFSGRLSVNPIQDLTRRTGLVALILLLISLSCSPVASIFAFRQALKLRRPLGLYAFFYAALHFLLFVWVDYRFDFELIWLDIREKPYIYAGASAFVILLALAITSFDLWKVKLGKLWKRLHRMVYLAAVLVSLHYAWVKKADLFRLSGEIRGPLMVIGILAILLLLRVPTARKKIVGWVAQIKG